LFIALTHAAQTKWQQSGAETEASSRAEEEADVEVEGESAGYQDSITVNFSLLAASSRVESVHQMHCQSHLLFN